MTFRDPVLGTVVVDERGKSCTIKRDGYRISIWLEREPTVEPFLPVARSIIALEKKFPAYRRKVTELVYPLWDRSWRQREDRFTQVGFTKRITIQTIQWSLDNPITELAVYFDDGGLFGGHSIVAALQDGEIVRAELAG